MSTFRLHGDNIIECERIANLLLKYCNPSSIERGFTSLACPYIIVHATFPIDFIFKVEFFPGFNKSHNDRWESNILDLLKAEGCFLDETPDIIFTELNDNRENILVALEFCSALQAGNQAWQRSGRAYSVGRAHCPYIYLLDFVKYELDTQTRSRKRLRFPNPAVVYSYISHSYHTQNFISQAYLKAEEFQPNFDKLLENFSEVIFGEQQVAEFLLQKMVHGNTEELEKSLLEKNFKMVEFLSSIEDKNSFTKSDWQNIAAENTDIVNYSKDKKLSYKKKIAEKSMFGKAGEFRDICSKYAIGVASNDLPFGLIPADKKADFGTEVISLYNITNPSIVELLLKQEDLLVCILKGFKPHGDDNRPDRGALPFASMLLNEEVKVLTFLFGPIVEQNATKLLTDYKSLYYINGLWKTVIGMSDVILVDSPRADNSESVEIAIYNTDNKQHILHSNQPIVNTPVPYIPNRYQENDVDAIIHYVFKYILCDYSFEGMCNPPGGDWSGLSVILSDNEYRWLSLPRVSPNGKRPDHVIELFGVSNEPIFLVVESKERLNDLENEIGVALKRYLSHLFSYKPSVVKNGNGSWSIAESICDFNNKPFISVGAFLKSEQFDDQELFNRTSCDMLFALQPDIERNAWIMEIYYRPQLCDVANFIKNNASNQHNIIIELK